MVQRKRIGIGNGAWKWTTARIGTMLAIAVTIPFASYFDSVSAPILLCLIMLCIGFISFFLYTIMDKKLDASAQGMEEEAEEPFRVSDIMLINKKQRFLVNRPVMRLILFRCIPIFEICD